MVNAMPANRTSTRKKTYEEHLQYVYEIVKLKLWFLWNWLKEHPNEDFIYALRKRVDICRKTDCRKEKGYPYPPDFEAPAWRALEEKTLLVYKIHKDDNSAFAFEHEAFEIFRKTLEVRSQMDYDAILTLN